MKNCPQLFGFLARQVFIAAWGIISFSMWLWFPGQGSIPGPLQWEHEVSATGPPREVAPGPDFERAPDGAMGALEEQTPCSSRQGQGIRAPRVGNVLL